LASSSVVPATVRIDLPIVAFDDADEIHDLAAPNRVMRYVAVRSGQLVPTMRAICGGKRPSARGRPPQPVNFGPVGAGQALAHLRVDAISADRGGFRVFASSETDLHSHRFGRE
jgi:hypothetical protein